MDSVDLLITAVEVNNHHGVGILLQRFFPDASTIVTLRSRTMYGGGEFFGRSHLELRSQFLTLADTRARLATLLAGLRVSRILCVPYYREDFIHGVLAKEITGAPLCTFIMDDQTIFASPVPAHWPARLLATSDLRLGISPELCVAYARRFSVGMELLPPVVTTPLPLLPCYWEPDAAEPLRAAMLGNVWTAARFEQLRGLTRTTGLHIDWYGNGSNASWLTGTPEEWEADHIRTMGFLPEEDLVAALGSYPFIVVPSGSLDQEDDNPAFSRLSLPSRLIFLHTTTTTPVLLLGSADTAAGRFIRRLGTGECCDYRPTALRQAVQRLTTPTPRRAIQQAIRRWAPSLVLPHAGEWIWSSLAQRNAQPAPFHAAFADSDSPAPRWLTSIAPFILPVAAPEPRADDLRPLKHLRTAHHAFVTAQGGSLPPIEELELGQFLRATVASIATAMSRRGDILVLDDAAHHWAPLFRREHHVWHTEHTNDWISGRGTNRGIKPLVPAHPASPAPAQYDVILSGSWFDQVSTPEQLAGLVAQLKAHTKPRGFNLHGATAVIHPDYFWTGPAHAHVRSAFGINDWHVDDLLSDPELYTMSGKAYDRHWRAATHRSYEDFGQAVALLLAWRTPGETLRQKFSRWLPRKRAR